MDRSVDSIGSCSLDVDAESSDISDISCSLNYLAPMLVKDTNRPQGFSGQCSQNSTVIMEQNSQQVRMVLTQPKSGDTETNDFIPDETRSTTEKKPSYLNLACCVNGYSNLTTYDSKIRQDINKSREVSPIRPSSNGIQHCKTNNTLVPPVLLPMPDNKTNSQIRITHNVETNNNHADLKANKKIKEEPEEHKNLSFIQQRVERLYGPGALAQNFYGPKKLSSSNCIRKVDSNGGEAQAPTELLLKFQELSPSKDYNKFQKKLNSEASLRATTTTEPRNIENNMIDLPVLRHLSQEFRAQLPKVSPKRNLSYSLGKEASSSNTNVNHFECLSNADEVDHKPQSNARIFEGGRQMKDLQVHDLSLSKEFDKSNVCGIDGRQFLCLLKNEQARLLNLANNADMYLEVLSSNSEISEDILGLLRSAAGKARLLVSQKMKQFEGLCHKNLNSAPEDEFPTTLDDLHGFWDMVNLQVDHVDTIFAEIEALKAVNWKKSTNTISSNAAMQQKVTNSKLKTAVSNENGKPQAQSAGAIKREAQRKKFLEMKRKNKVALSKSNNTESVNSDCLNSDAVEIYMK